jgi:hypothetical protein
VTYSVGGSAMTIVQAAAMYDGRLRFQRVGSARLSTSPRQSAGMRAKATTASTMKNAIAAH